MFGWLTIYDCCSKIRPHNWSLDPALDQSQFFSKILLLEPYFWNAKSFINDNQSHSASDRPDESPLLSHLGHSTTILSFPLPESRIIVELLPGHGLMQVCCTDFPPRQPGLSSVRRNAAVIRPANVLLHTSATCRAMMPGKPRRLYYCRKEWAVTLVGKVWRKAYPSCQHQCRKAHNSYEKVHDIPRETRSY